MTAVSALLRDLESRVTRGSNDDRAQTMSRLTDLLVATANDITEDQIGVFDVVIGRLATAIESRARAELSERLADVHNAPAGVVRQLALDEISVARPVLARSSRLTDEDLIAIASAKGRDHMLAISERPILNEPVTDFLVLRGDRLISHAIAGNAGARFSSRGINVLVTRAIKDDALQATLGVRKDVPEELVQQLVKAAKESARMRLSVSLPQNEAAILASALDRGAADVTSQKDVGDELGRFGKALSEVRRLSDAGKLDEHAVGTFAGLKSTEEVICAVAVLARLPLSGAERALFGSDRDSTLILGRALDWSWDTVRLVLSLRSAEDNVPHLIERARVSYVALAPATAQRVLRFLQIRDQAGHSINQTITRAAPT
jgi:uncharacterized protein (DUF2336 family)